jgi:hypothetical protein
MKILMILLLLTSCANQGLRYESNTGINELEEVISIVKVYCKKDRKITFSSMPEQLKTYYPKEHIGHLTYINKEPLIEINITAYRRLDIDERKLFLFHEIGHSFGLLHSDGIMHPFLKEIKDPNYKEYFKKIETACKSKLETMLNY